MLLSPLPRLSILAQRCLISLVPSLFVAPAVSAEALPLVDTHIHYSHDAWVATPPKDAVAILRKAGLTRAFVSSSSDEGTQKLYALAPDFIVPVLRPYRRRGETGTWYKDASVVEMLSGLLEKNTYAGIGEFHIFGEDVDLPVMRAVVGLAKKHGVFLHAHSDADAVDRIFQQNPNARVLWAHSGFDTPEVVGAMLGKYPNLWADLAFRTDHANGDEVDPEWREVFLAFPDRFMIGTDTYTPERWYFVEEHAKWSRNWLNSLPADVRVKIASKNAETLAAWALGDGKK